MATTVRESLFNDIYHVVQSAIWQAATVEDFRQAAAEAWQQVLDEEKQAASKAWSK